jgi:hypothetical protein
VTDLSLGLFEEGDSIATVNTRDADKSLALPTSRYILFDSWNIAFDASLIIHTDFEMRHPRCVSNRTSVKCISYDVY